MDRRVAMSLVILLTLAGVLSSGCLGPGASNQPPVASFTLSRTEALVGDVISFDASASSDDRGIARYHFEFGDASSKDGMVVTHAYAAAGRYLVQLSITDSDGLVSTAERNVTISDPPAKNIGVACVKTNATAYKCAVTSADAGVDFSQVSVQVLTSGDVVVCAWPKGFAINSPASGVTSPVGSGKNTDNGDVKFGPGDDFYLAPVYDPSTGAATTSLVGLRLRLSGGGAIGEATLN